MFLTLALVTTPFAGGAVTARKGDESLQAIESRLTDSVRNSAASVVRIHCGSEKGTGCFVTTDGCILTAAHVIAGQHEDPVRVRLSDGMLRTAVVVLADVDNDLAVLRIEPPDRATVAQADPVVLAETVPEVGSLVFAAGFPGWLSDNLRSPTIRLGAIVAVHNTLMRSGCKLTTGDSGGPVFDVDGHLVGINLQIGNRADDNVHRTLPAILRTLEDAGVAPMVTASGDAVSLQQLAAAGSDKAAPTLAALRVTLHSIDAEGRRDEKTATAIGTLWDSHTVLSKLSLLPATGYQCRIAGEQITTAEVVRTDPGRDLAVLHLADAAAVPKHFLPGGLPDSKTLPGDRSEEWTARLVCSGVDGNWGVISAYRHAEPSSSAVLGMSLKRTPDALLIRRIEKDAAADRAQLRADDQIIRVGKHPAGLPVLQQLTETMRRSEPGDWIAITVLRGDEEIDFPLQTDSPPNQLLDRDRFLDGRAGRLSRRRTGFRKVIRHDATVAPSECGGPLVDTSGRLIGINIARASRESMFAVPADEIGQMMNDEVTPE